MRFPGKKNTGCPKAPLGFPPRKDGILHPLPIGLSWNSPPPPPEPVRAGVQAYADVTTKISRIDRLPNLLSNGAPLARERAGSAMKKIE